MKPIRVTLCSNGAYWQARWYDRAGQRCSQGLGAKATTSRRKAMESCAAIAAEFARDPALASTEDMTVGQWVQLYPGETGDLDPRTVKLHAITGRYLTECLGDTMLMRDVGPEHVRRFAKWLSAQEINRDDGKGGKRRMGAATVNAHLRNAGRMFEVALERSHALVVRNPFAGKVRKELNKVYRVGKARHEHVSIEAMERLLEACSAPWQRAVIVLGRLAGLRLSEAQDLAWGDIDWKGGRLTVRAKQDDYGREVTTTKRDRRVVPMSDALAKHLEALYNEAPPGSGGPVYGFPNRTNYAKRLRGVIKRAGLADYGKPLHALRASCENDWMDKYPLPDVAEWIGHDITVAMKNYRERGAQRRIDSFNAPTGTTAAQLNPSNAPEPQQTQ